MKCSNCGSEIKPGTHFCPQCGSSVQEDDSLDHGFEREETVTSDTTEQIEVSADPDDYMEYLDEQEITETRPDSLYQEETNNSDGPISKSLLLKIGLIAVLVIVVAVVCVFAYQRFSEVDKFTEEDARLLVQEELDVFKTGNYDQQEGLDDKRGKDILDQREKYINDFTKECVDLFEKRKFSVSDEQKNTISDLVDKSLKKTEYNAESSKQMNDDLYIVTVSVKPLEVYSGLDYKFFNDLVSRVIKEKPELSKDKNKLYEAVLDGILEQISEGSLENPKYRDKESVPVHLHKNDDEEWNIDQSDLRKVQNKLIYTDEFLQDVS